MTTAAVAFRGRCPHCGAELAFRIGSARAAVCEYCQTLVARRGQSYEDLGKVADLIPTGTQIALGDSGRYENASFRIVGRLQYQWEQGVWDEWHIALDDGRWGWLAEAQGRYYVTFKTARRGLPEANQLKPGETVLLDGLGRHVVTDIKQATIVTAAGELPEEIALGSRPLTVDLEGARGFATIDYGDGSSAPILFSGDQVRLADLALEDTSGRAIREGEPRVLTDKLRCPHCGAPVEIRVPGQTVRLSCESCNSLLDASQGPLQLIGALDRLRTKPPIPIGTTGTLRGVEYLVVGYLRRSCSVEGVRYSWDELLLYDPKATSFSWLVRNDGHWQFAAPISAAEVNVANGAHYKGRRYKYFSGVTGRVDAVFGEFYWAVSVGDEAQLDDYIAPPEGLSRERSSTEREVNWSHITHLEAKEVAQAFRTSQVSGFGVVGVGATQPYPYERDIKSLNLFLLGGFAAVIAIALLSSGGQTSVMRTGLRSEELLTPNEEAPAAEDPNRRVFAYLSPPFDLAARKPIEVKLESNVTNSWVAASGAIIPSGGGESASFDLESAFYAGIEDGESWSEGNRSGTDELSAVPAGQYVLRADLEWDPKLQTPPDVAFSVAQGGLSVGQFFLVLLGLGLPLLFNLHRQSFEKARWENSTVGGD